MAVVPSASPRSKLARIGRSRDAMVARIAEIEARLAVLPIREAEARVEALRRNPEKPVVEDELIAQVAGERVELERELSELVGNLAAANRVIGEAQQAAEAELRSEAVAQAEAFREEERSLWAETVKAWKAVTACYEKLNAHQVRVSASRPNAYLPADEDAFVVSPTPIGLDVFVSLLVAAGRPGGFDPRQIDSNGVLQRLVPPYQDPRAELRGDLGTRREPIRP